jgi:hypothetical protein
MASGLNIPSSQYLALEPFSSLEITHTRQPTAFLRYASGLRLLKRNSLAGAR